MKTKQWNLTLRDRELLAHVQRARRRKMTLAEYCRAQGLNVQCVYNLRHRMRRRIVARRRQPGAVRRKSANKFIAVRVASQVAPTVAACRLQMKGLVIECASLPPAAWLAGLMVGDVRAVP